MTEKKQITLRLPGEVARGLRELSDELGISVNALITMACLQATKRENLRSGQQSSDKHK